MKRYQNDRGLSGLNTLAYMGVEPSTPPNLTQEDRRPTTHDYAEFRVGSIWLVKNTEEVWMLVDKNGGLANWTMLTSGDLAFLTDAGTYAYPLAGVIHVVGGPNIDTSAIPPDSENLVIGLQDDVTIPGNVHITSLSVGGVLQTDATGLLFTSNGTNGQVMIGGGAAPVWANLTSSDLSITITNTPNAIDLVAVGGGGGGFGGLIDDVGVTATPDVNHKVTVTGVGGVGITTAATPGTLTLNIGGSTLDGQLLIGNAGGTASWARLTSTGGSVTITNGPGSTINLEAAGVAALTALTADDANDAAPLAGKITIHGSEVPNWVVGQPLITTTAAVANTLDVNLNYPLQDGYVLISSNAGVPKWAPISGSASVTVTPNHNAITLTAVGGGGSGVQIFDCISGVATPDPATPTKIFIEGDALVTSGGYNNITTRGTADLVEIVLQPRIYLPNTNTGGTTGVLYLNNVKFLHNYGTANTFLGADAGRLTLTTANAINNTGIGYHALTALTGTAGTKAANNVAVGFDSLALCTDGYRNTSLGSASSDALTTGYENVSVGCGSLSAAVTSAWNTAVGSQSLAKTTSSQNTAVGWASAFNQTSGTYSTAMGYHSLFSNVTSSYNTAIGHSSLQGCTAGNNTALGYQSGLAINTGVDNVILGSGALKNGTSASDNVTIGVSAMGTGVVVGGGNVAIGSHALDNLTGGAGTGTSNVAIGYGVGNLCTTANHNVLIGYYAAGDQGFPPVPAMVDGTRNVIIGSESRTAAASVDGSVSVGPQNIMNSSYAIAIGSGVIADDDNSIAIGYQSHTTGQGSIAIGDSSGRASSGTFNTLVGFSSTTTNVGDDYAIAIGYQTEASTNSIAIGKSTTAITNSAHIGAGSAGCYIDNVYNQAVDLSYKQVFINSAGKLAANQASPVNQSFLYIQVGNVANVTGDGTTYQLGSKKALTQIFDAAINNVYPGDGISLPCYFVAPITGRYFLMMSAKATNLFPPAPTPAFSTPYSIVTTRRQYDLVNSIFQAQTNGEQSYSVSCIADMDAADRAYFQFDVVYNGIRNIGCGGAVNINTPCATFISGFLIP